MNQPRSIFEATQRFIMKHFVSQRCGSRPQKRNSMKILYHLSLPAVNPVTRFHHLFWVSDALPIPFQSLLPAVQHDLVALGPPVPRRTTLEATVTHCWGYADCHAGVVALGALQLGQSKDRYVVRFRESHESHRFRHFQLEPSHDLWFVEG